MKRENMNQCEFNRREFLKLSGAATLCTAVTMLTPSAANAFLLDACQDPPILSGYKPSIASAWIAKGMQENSYATFKATIEAATDFSWLSNGDTVFLKLALNSGKPSPYTTDPWLVKSMIKLLNEKGAGKVFVGDQSGAEYVILAKNSRRGASRKLCATAGLLDVITQNGAQPVFFDENEYDDYFAVTPPTPHHWPKPLYVTNAINQFDHIIYLPRVGAHVLADFSAAMKIAVGFLRDDSRLVLHKGGENFYAMYEEISLIPQIASKLRLSVSSGLKALTTLGPDNGYVSEPDYGLVFASNDLYAHDSMSYAWLYWNYVYNTPDKDKTAGQLTQCRALINDMFTAGFFIGVDGYTIMPSDLPTNDCLPKICLHRAMKNFIDRKGGRPENFTWNQITQHPDHSVPDYMLKIMKGDSGTVKARKEHYKGRVVNNIT